MKYILTTFYILLVFHCYSQRYVKDYQDDIDTIQQITILKQEEVSIFITEGNKEFRFEKKSMLDKIARDLNDWESYAIKTKQKPDIEFAEKQIANYKKVTDYIQSEQTLSFKRENYSNVDFESAQKDVKHLTYLFISSLACELFDSGNFSLLKNQVPQNKITKATVVYWDELAGTSYIEYILPDGEMVWTCSTSSYR